MKVSPCDHGYVAVQSRGKLKLELLRILGAVVPQSQVFFLSLQDVNFPHFRRPDYQNIENIILSFVLAVY